MKNKKVFIAVIILLLLVSLVVLYLFVSANENKKFLQENNNPDNDKEINTEGGIELPFTTVPITTLKEGMPDDKYIKGKSIYFSNLENQIESTLHLYIDNSHDPNLRPGEGIIYGYLEHDNKLYELGAVCNYGIDEIKVNLADRTFDGIKEIEIEGDMGATYSEMKIISYNETNLQWENLLTMGTPNIVDLDSDGKEELVAGSAGSLPTYLDIYRWNNNHFEKADIAEFTGNDYAHLSNTIDTDGKYFIEAGLLVDGKPPESTLYKYGEGKLIKYK